jgi:hypothetical protein
MDGSFVECKPLGSDRPDKEVRIACCIRRVHLLAERQPIYVHDLLAARRFLFQLKFKQIVS